ncbi:hypothetical protein E2C01_085911 [Portunus trituberculatus]|uniref:Uncharacterized protein n=1 Tax=Portunus trituberculatus TaxID=210409 RepID=A0A5B7JC06_PORTR|nr:hypothetical protein [Portunus trituberculatus]
MKKQRLDFCKRYEHWTSEDWRRVVFSDESAFKTISHRQKLVRRPLGADRFDSHYTVKAVKFPADGASISSAVSVSLTWFSYLVGFLMGFRPPDLGKGQRSHTHLMHQPLQYE